MAEFVTEFRQFLLMITPHIVICMNSCGPQREDDLVQHSNTLKGFLSKSYMRTLCHLVEHAHHATGFIPAHKGKKARKSKFKKKKSW